MDFYDYALKFSSEVVVLVLALGIITLNLKYFYIGEDHSDKSFASRFLSNHPDLNEKLYQKNSVITTKVINNHGILPVAQADELTGLNAAAGQEDNYQESDEGQSFSGDVVTQPKSDTLSALISKQIKVYETKSGDTLGSIAAANGISVSTIMWANKLSSETIKPGWFLVLLPTDGVLHQASSNDTLPDIAKKYSANLETIIAYNGLENAEDIDSGQLIIVPGGKIPEPPKPKPSPSTGKTNAGQIAKPKIIDNGTGHVFPWGYCTWYVATKVHVPWGGNAKNWLANAKAYGAVTSNEPAVGSIVVTTDNKYYGHVALVTDVDDAGFTVSEMNYEKFGKVNTRWISKNSKTVRGFIYR